MDPHSKANPREITATKKKKKERRRTSQK